MKRSAIILPLLLLGHSLYSQIDYTPPEVGRCDTVELRVRDQPRPDATQVGSLFRGEEVVVLSRTPGKETIDGRTAAWYQVCSMKGLLGWVFGGYFAANDAGVKVVEFGDYDSPTAEVKDYSKGFAGGALVLVRFNWIELQPTTYIALFIKAPGAAPRVLFVEFAGDTFLGRQEVTGAEFLDLVGDAKKEICVTMSGGSGDSQNTFMRVYGDLGKGYVFLGGIDLGLNTGGGGDGIGGYEEVQSGPVAVIEKGVKLVKVVIKSVYTGPRIPEDEGMGTGDRSFYTTTKVYEVYYELVSGKLVSTRTKLLSSVEMKAGTGQ